MSVDKCRLEVQQVMHGSQPQSSVTAWAGWATTNPPLRNKPVIVRDQNVLGMSVFKLIAVQGTQTLFYHVTLLDMLAYIPPRIILTHIPGTIHAVFHHGCSCAQLCKPCLWVHAELCQTPVPLHEASNDQMARAAAHRAPHQSLPCLHCPLVSLNPHLASAISTLPILPPGQSTPSPCLVLPCQMLLQLTNCRAWGSTSSFYVAFVAFSAIHSLSCVVGFNCKTQHCLHAQHHLCWVVFG